MGVLPLKAGEHPHKYVTQAAEKAKMWNKSVIP